MGTVAEEWMKQGEARGRAEGEAKGRAEGKAAMLTRMLERRFGELPGWAHERIHLADDTQLDLWADTLFDARALGEVFTSDRES